MITKSEENVKELKAQKHELESNNRNIETREEELNKLNYGMLGFSIVPRPVAGHGLIYVITSFMRPQLLAIDYLSSNKPSIKWKWNRGVSNQPSAILVGDEIYFVSDNIFIN